MTHYSVNVIKTIYLELLLGNKVYCELQLLISLFLKLLLLLLHYILDMKMRLIRSHKERIDERLHT